MLPSDSLITRRHFVRSRRQRGCIFLGFAWLGAATLLTAADLEVTKTSGKEIDVPAEVAKFVQTLVAENADVKAQFDKLTAAARQEAGGRFSVGNIKAVEWLVPSYENNFRSGHGERASEQLFLVQQQLISGFHHGYSITRNVMSQVRTTLHSEFREDPTDPKAKNGFVLTSNKLTMKFEGFVTVTITPRE